MMGPIDPELLLKTLSPLLDVAGGLRGSTEAKRMASLVNDASKHVAKCIYMQILSATTDQAALQMFISVGGWDTLHGWLQEMREEEDGAMLMELLRVYQKLPVTIELLKQNQAAKTIKQLSKAEDSNVKELATEIVDCWMQKIRAKGGSDNDGKSKKKKSSRDKERDRSDRDRDRDKDKESKSKDKSKSTHHHHHHHHHHHNNREREMSEVEGDDFRDRSESSNSAAEDKAAAAASSRAAAEDSSQRPKTVKKFGSKFRSTGLFEEEILPVKKKTNEATSRQPPKRPLAEVRGEEQAGGEKRPRLTLSMSTLMKNAASSSGTSSSSSIPVTSTTSPTTPSPATPPSPAEIHRGIKLIPPKKPPAHEFQESSGFMDSLTRTASYGQVKRRRKLPPAGSKAATTTATSTATSSTAATSTSSTSHAAPLKLVPSFYRDTLETSEEAETKKEEAGDKAGNGAERQEEPMQTENGEAEGGSERRENQEEEKGAADGEEGDQGEEEGEGGEAGGEPRGLLTTGTTRRRRKAKKKVSWADDSCIRQVFYFEMDETERVNVNRPKDFNQMKKEEQFNDRKTLEVAKRLSNDNMQEVIPWRRPRPLDISALPVERGGLSVERKLQQEREKGVLQAIFFSKDMLPDSPMEPDLEEVEHVEPKLIPLEDENAQGEEFSYTYDDMYHQNSAQSASLPPAQGSMGGGAQGSMGGGAHSSHGQQDSGVALTPELLTLLAECRPHQPPPLPHPPHPQHPGMGLQPQQPQHPPLHPGMAPGQQAGGGSGPTGQNISVAEAEHLLQLLLSGNLGIGEQQRHEMTERLQQVLEPYHQNAGLGGVQGGMQHPPQESLVHQGAPPAAAAGGFHGGRPSLGLLGNAPPGYQPLRPGGPGGPVGPGGPGGPVGPVGPVGPRFPFPGGMDAGDEWGENMVGGPGGRGGLGRPGFPLRHRGPPPHLMRGRGGPRPRGMGGRAVCRHFAANGACRFGNSCNFLHPGVNGPLQ